MPHRRPDWTPVAPAIIQSSTFTNPVGSEEEVLYTRYGNNPNQVALAGKYALLEGAEEALFCASGMGATALAHLAVLRPGDHLHQQHAGSTAAPRGCSTRSWPGSGSRHLRRPGAAAALAQGGAEDDPRHLRGDADQSADAGGGPDARSPTWREEFGLALLVDATFASPINFRPLEHGADVVITSATKYLNGHSDVIAGAVAGSASFVEEVTPADAGLGPGDRSAHRVADRPGDADARGPDGAAQRQRAGGRRVGRAAPGIRAGALPRPALPSGPRARPAPSLGGLRRHGRARAHRRRPRRPSALLKRLKLIAHAPSLAGVESLVSEPRLTSHKELGARAAARRSASPTDSSG